MDLETLLVNHDGPVATVTLNRPDALNAITPTMLDELVETFSALEADDSVSVIVLTGAGRAFSAGVDLKALGRRRLDGGKVGDLLDIGARRLTTLMTTMGKVVIAKVNGFCFTGALELALACDILIAADDAKFGDTHARFGLRPTWGMSQRLYAAAGPAKARELAYTAAMFSGAQAEAWGIASRSCPRSQLDEVVAAVAADVAATSAGSRAAYKDLFAQAEQLGLHDGLIYEASTEYEIADTEARIADFR